MALRLALMLLGRVLPVAAPDAAPRGSLPRLLLLALGLNVFRGGCGEGSAVVVCWWCGNGDVVMVGGVERMVWWWWWFGEGDGVWLWWGEGNGGRERVVKRWKRTWW